MSIQNWYPFSGMEQALFQPNAGGYLYRAPNSWLFGSARYYVVTDGQKAKLATYHRRALQLTFLGIIVAVVIAAPISGDFFARHFWIGLGLSALVGLVLGLTINGVLARKVKPIVAGLPPSHDRITRTDAFKLRAGALSNWFILTCLVLSLLLLVMTGAYAIYGAEGWDVSNLVAVGLFGFNVIYFAGLYIAKRRQAAR
jgi:hypothetical protein